MAAYAVTGASGQLGRLAVHELLVRGVPAADVVAVVRTPGRAADLARRGVQVREADYAHPLALRAAGVPFTLLRNGWYTENYTDQLGTYLSKERSSAPPATAASRLEQAGLNDENARFVAALDASIANGDLETSTRDLEQLLEHPVTPIVDAVRAARGGH